MSAAVPGIAGQVTSRRLVPRPVVCVIEAEHRDVSRADAVVAGRFSHAGQTVELGPEVDWLAADLPDDDEWRIEWSKFYYGLDLAYAYRLTGKARYLAAWERLVASWLDQVPLGHDTSDVAARRVQNWLYAWQAFARAPGFPGLAAGLDLALGDAIAEHVAWIHENLTPERNHRTLELYALLVAGLALPDRDPPRIAAAGGLARVALSELGRNLATDVLDDGVQREGSTHYHLIVLRSFLGAIANARAFGLPLPPGFLERVSLACDFALHVQRPDGEIPAVSDADNGRYAGVLLLASDLLGRDDLRWAATTGRSGTPPRSRAVSFPEGGYHVQRSGWGDGGCAYEDERFLLLDCGPLGAGGHGHYDALSVEAYGGGRPLVVDPGRFTYAELAPNLRRWFKSTAAHNTVVVDGLDQTPYRRGKPRSAVARARLCERLRGPGLDIVRGEVVSPCYDAVHRRRVVFVAGEYWLIEDVLEAASPHRYDLRFHLAAGTADRVRPRCQQGGACVEAPGLALVILGAAQVRVEAGWVAPEYGVRLPAPVISATVEQRDAARFLTLLAPRRPGRPAPVMAAREESCVTVVTVIGAGAGDSIDLVAWTADGRTGRLAELGDLVGEAAAAGWVRSDRDGNAAAAGSARAVAT